MADNIKQLNDSLIPLIDKIGVDLDNALKDASKGITPEQEQQVKDAIKDRDFGKEMDDIKERISKMTNFVR